MEYLRGGKGGGREGGLNGCENGLAFVRGVPLPITKIS